MHCGANASLVALGDDCLHETGLTVKVIARAMDEEHLDEIGLAFRDTAYQIPDFLWRIYLDNSRISRIQLRHSDGRHQWSAYRDVRCGRSIGRISNIKRPERTTHIDNSGDPRGEITGQSARNPRTRPGNLIRI